MRTVFMFLCCVLLVTCMTPEVEHLSPAGVLNPDKAYFGGTFYYNWHQKVADFELSSDVGAALSLSFRGSSLTDIDLYETDPGNYQMKGIRVWNDTWWKKLMGTPLPLQRTLPMKQGTVTYLGDYAVNRQQDVLRGVWHEVTFNYDPAAFEKAVREQYRVPESMVFQ